MQELYGVSSKLNVSINALNNADIFIKLDLGKMGVWQIWFRLAIYFLELQLAKLSIVDICLPHMYKGFKDLMIELVHFINILNVWVS